MSIELATDEPFQHLTRQTNKLMEQLQKGFFFTGESWTPSVNLYETAAGYLVCVDLAGVDKEKIDIEVADRRLRLRGTRVVPMQPQSADNEHQEKIRVHLMEIDHGAFTRDVEIPSDADQHRISATYRNGLLWIEIPKSA